MRAFHEQDFRDCVLALFWFVRCKESERGRGREMHYMCSLIVCMMVIGWVIL